MVNVAYIYKCNVKGYKMNLFYESIIKITSFFRTIEKNIL